MKTLKFEELKSLDLKKCATVGDIVDAMRYCAFGARMLGEVARTVYEMITSKESWSSSVGASVLWRRQCAKPVDGAPQP